MNFPYMNDIGSMVWVNNKAEINNIMVPPNKQKVFFLKSADECIFYVVSANELGMTSVRTFRFEEYVETRPDDKFVTKQEFQKLVDMLGGLKNESTVSTK